MHPTNSAAPDARLVERARAGDAAAFDALVRRHYRSAYAVALSASRNPSDAEDVVQDAFVRALERLDECRDPERFAGWLLRIVRNRAHNLREYERLRAAEPLEPDAAAGHDSPARDAENAELRERMTKALARITSVQREVVLLHDMSGWPHREIAAALGISEVMSRQHLFNARRALRRLLDPLRALELRDPA